MENLKLLLATIVASTLVFSVGSSVNSNYFAGLKAYADDSGKDQEDSDNTTDNDERPHDDQDNVEIVQALAAHSNATIDPADDEVSVDVHESDLQDGTYHVTFNCSSPDINKQFEHSLAVEAGQGEFEAQFTFENGTYIGCEVSVGGLSAVFATFDVLNHDETDDEHNGQQNDDRQNNAGEDDKNNKHNGDQQNNANDEKQNNRHNGQQNDEDHDVKEKRKEKIERIVSSASGEEHKRHRNANPASPGDYATGWDYNLSASGSAKYNETRTSTSQVDLNMTVWKSTHGLVLLDVMDGTVDVGNHTYTIVTGYAFYSVQHDAMKIASLAVDEDGNIVKLKLRGNGDESSTFPGESGSVSMTLEGSAQSWDETIGDWKLALDGTVTA